MSVKRRANAKSSGWQTPLQMGMCGGPVVNARGACIGVVEGIVPETGTQFTCFPGTLLVHRYKDGYKGTDTDAEGAGRP